MPIFLLTRTDEIGWDEYESMTVIAKSPEEARQLANERTGDEGKIWTNHILVLCEQIDENGPSEIINAAFRAG